MTKKKAFTLAELLLTLSIIGVIAAMTIPSVMFRTDKKISSTGLKRAIATLNQAVDMAKTELKFQPAIRCHNGNTSHCGDLFDYMKDVLQVQKYCKEKAVDSGCAPKNYSNENPCLKDLNNYKAFVTTDGMIFFENGNGARVIGVDINGQRGPNKSGYDVFFVELTGTQSTMQTYQPGGCTFVEPGGVSGATLMQNDN